jgi:hypothetical protein
MGGKLCLASLWPNSVSRDGFIVAPPLPSTPVCYHCIGSRIQIRYFAQMSRKLCLVTLQPNSVSRERFIVAPSPPSTHRFAGAALDPRSRSATLHPRSKSRSATLHKWVENCAYLYGQTVWAGTRERFILIHPPPSTPVCCRCIGSQIQIRYLV